MARQILFVCMNANVSGIYFFVLEYTGVKLY